MDYDRTNIAEGYDRSRSHGPEFLKLWMDTVASHVDADAIGEILDLGCGTGRFSQALATRFNARVIGIDPSRKMLIQAHSNKTGDQALYVGGFGEAIPLPSDSVDMVFISMVFHHFDDPVSAARECRRVLRERGRVFLRSGTLDRIEQYPYVPFFPTSRPLLEQRLPTLASQRTAFEIASFITEFSGTVVQQIAPDYATYAEKLSYGGDSVLASLDPAEFAAGLEAIRAHPAGDKPVVEPIDVVVFAK